MEASNRVGDIDVMEEEEVLDEDDEDEEEDEEDEVEKKTNYAAISSKTQKKAPALLAAARDPTNDTLLHAAELEAEARGIAPAQFESELAVETKKAKKAAPKKIGGKKIDRSQEEQLASIMLTGKQKKLYNKMSYSRDRKLEEVSFLLSPVSF
jgi:pescadillo protein